MVAYKRMRHDGLWLATNGKFDHQRLTASAFFQIVLKEDAVPKTFNLPMESCKPEIGHKAKKNKRIMPAEHRANSSAISKIRFVFRSKSTGKVENFHVHVNFNLQYVNLDLHYL